MKNLFFVFVALLLVLTSCNKEDDLLPQDDPVIMLKSANGAWENANTSEVLVVERGMILFLMTEDEGDSFLWDFGDGSGIATGSEVIHAYSEIGAFTLTLTVTTGGVESSTTLTISVIAAGTGGDDSIYLESSNQQPDGKWTYVLHATKSKVYVNTGTFWTTGDHNEWAQIDADTSGNYVVIPVTTYNDTLEIHYGRGATWNDAQGSKYAVQEGDNYVIRIVFSDGEIFPVDYSPLKSVPGIGDNLLRIAVESDTLYAYSNTSISPIPINKPFFHLFINEWEVRSQEWYNGTGWGVSKMALADLPSVIQLKFGGNSDSPTETYADITTSVFFNNDYQCLAFQVVQSTTKSANTLSVTDKNGKTYSIKLLN